MTSSSIFLPGIAVTLACLLAFFFLGGEAETQSIVPTEARLSLEASAVQNLIPTNPEPRGTQSIEEVAPPEEVERPVVNATASGYDVFDDPFNGVETPMGGFQPPVDSSTFGSAWFAASMKQDWNTWATSSPGHRTARRDLSAALQRALSVVLYQTGSYEKGSGKMRDSMDRPLQFIINGYSYYFSAADFPEYDALNKEIARLQDEDFHIDPFIVSQVRSRIDEALAYLGN